jgi:hypothetical protein
VADTNILSGASSAVEAQSLTQGATTVYQQTVTIGDGANVGRVAKVSAIGELSVSDPDSTATGTITATDAVLGVHSGTGAVLTGTPTAGSYVAFPLTGGESGFTLRLSGTFGGGTVWMESSVDSTNGVDGGWVTNLVRQSGADITFLDTSLTAAGVFRGVAAGYAYLRVRATGATAPSVAVAFRASGGPSVTALVASLPPGANTIGNVRTNTGAAATITVVASSVTSGTILAANAARNKALIFNDSREVLRISYGTTTTSATALSLPIAAGQVYVVEEGWTGAITGMWAAANGNARVTEF